MSDETNDTNPLTPLADESAALSDVHDDILDTTTESTYNDGPDRSTVPTGSQLLIALSLLGGLFGASYLPLFSDTFSNMEQSTVEQTLRERDTRVEAASVAEPEIQAVSAFVWDVKEQRALYNRNASAQLPLASLTKLMTALVAVESLGNKGQVAMTLDAINQYGPSDFADGEVFPAKALADFVLVSSSNDGAYALAAAAGAALLGSGTSSEPTFVEAMNVRAEELGLSQTYFSNPTGLDNSASESGSYGSARDMAFLMEYLVKNRPDIIEGSIPLYTSVAGTTVHTASNTNDVLLRIPNLLGTKTGYTDLAGGNLVVAFNAGLDRPVIVSILGSTREGRFNDVLSLVKYAQATLASE